MSSDNPFGADNQQETKGTRLDPSWLVGFVDGEGCFSVSIHRNRRMQETRGWQLQTAFQVYQHRDGRVILDEIERFFECGRVVAKGPTSNVLTYTVWSLRDLERRIVPFFEQHPLRLKAGDFFKFAHIVRSMRSKEHLTPTGFSRLATLAYSMNKNGKQRSRRLEEVLAGSSETARQAPHRSG